MSIPSAEKGEFIRRCLDSGKYLVTPDGVIWNLSTRDSGFPVKLKYGKTDDGYPICELSDGSRKRPALVHRVVAIQYLPQSDLSMEVNHKDGDKANSCVWNLEWVSRSHNVEHAYESGLKSRYRNRATKQFSSRLSDDDVREIHRLRRDCSQTYGQIASRYSLSRAAIYMIIKGKNHRHIFEEFEK